MVWKQNGAGIIYPSALSLAQGRQKTSVQKHPKNRGRNVKKKQTKPNQDKRPELGLHSTGRSCRSTTGVQPRQNHFSQHAGICEGNVSPCRESPQPGWDGASRERLFGCKGAALSQLLLPGNTGADIATACTMNVPGLRPRSDRAQTQLPNPRFLPHRRLRSRGTRTEGLEGSWGQDTPCCQVLSSEQAEAPSAVDLGSFA